jgi:hypothetical protein
MADQASLDTILAELRQELSDTLTMITIVIQMRQNTDQLLRYLTRLLGDLHTHIWQALPSLPAEEENDQA